MWLDDRLVSVSVTDLTSYPDKVPFDPPVRYPEISVGGIDPDNQVYRWVRETIHQLGLDAEHYDTPSWNPFKGFVRPGMTVLIKPNTVSHEHWGGKDVMSMIVHASVIRPLIDYVCIALENRGEIIIGDSQLLFSAFDQAMDVSGLGPLLDWYRQQTSIPIQCFDLRMVRAKKTYAGGRWGREKVEADPRGYRWVDLGSRSRLDDLDPKTFRIAVAPPKEMFERHERGRHEYLLPQSVLDSHVIINVPKLKTHRRAAVTLSLKNFFGLVSHKGSLPHYRIGSPSEGGDEYIYPSIRKRLYSRLHDQVQSRPHAWQQFILANLRNAVWATRYLVPFKDPINESMWYGNDTIWRTLWDIFTSVIYADRDGCLHNEPQRNHFCLIDGIIGGERNGPIAPDPRPAGTLIAGLNPVAIDAVGATLMGFDVQKIPTIRQGLAQCPPDFLDSIQIQLGCQPTVLAELPKLKSLKFEPHPQWKGKVELAAKEQ